MLDADRKKERKKDILTFSKANIGPWERMREKERDKSRGRLRGVLCP